MSNTKLENFLNSGWELVIGLEVHAQVTSKSKLFSAASTAFGAQPNTQVDFIDAGMPGMLPVVNRRCIEAGILSGLALGAKINRRSVFARKNYFYPDLPQGYQISQFEEPLVIGGSLAIHPTGGQPKTINLTRIHIEQDAGKSLHDVAPNVSYIDLNRCGVALMEIVTEPEMSSAAEATDFVARLRTLLRSIGVCDGNMQEGSLRADANLSVRRVGDKLGTRSETKNLNSLKFLRAALEYEAVRQIELIESGKEVVQETRLFNSDTGVTQSMRSKEEAHDYRYFPDPDLLPVILSEEEIAKLRESLPELPEERAKRYVEQHKLAPDDAKALAQDIAMTEYFEALLAAGTPAVLACAWFRAELIALTNKHAIEVKECPIKPERFAGLLAMIDSKEITGKIAKDVLVKMWSNNLQAAETVEKYGLKPVDDVKALELAVDKLIADNPGQVKAFREGRTKLRGWFVGQMMQIFQGKADPAIVNKLLDDKLPQK